MQQFSENGQRRSDIPGGVMSYLKMHIDSKNRNKS